MKNNKHGSGYRAIEKLLLLIALSGILFTGYYVYRADQIATATFEKTEQVAEANAPAPDIRKKSTRIDVLPQSDSWLMYSAPNGEYSLRLADGWKLQRYMRSANMYTFLNESLLLKPGTPASVTQVNGGRDGSAEGLYISFSDKINNLPQGKKVKTFKTAAGDIVQVYSHIESEATSTLGMLDKGGTYYNYFVDKTQTKHMTFSYGFNLGQRDNHAVIESAISSLVIR